MDSRGIREPSGSFTDPLAFKTEKRKEPDTSAESREFALPADSYSPSMHTSRENLKPGSRVLRNGWMMIVSEKMPGADAPGWKPIKMPSQWAVEDPKLFSHGGNVWYRRTFIVKPGESGPDKHLQLKFMGVDYQSEVYLNDEKVGAHEGYFTPFTVNLDGKARRCEPNTLMVKVSAPKDPGGLYLKEQVKGIFGQHDCRPGGKDAPGTVGNTGGIWNDVLLESTGKESIENQFVETTLSPDHRQAALSFHYLLVNHGDAAREVTVETRYAPAGEKDPEKLKVISRRVELKPGFNQVSLEAVEQDPKLWWSHDHGEPNLYRMETAIRDGETLSDAKSGHFGIRKVEYDPTTGVMKLNDEAMFQRGTNYIPTEWLSTHSERKFERDVHKMKEANLNAVRVHAHVLPQEFYDVADREGMLVWADFPLIWGTNPLPKYTDKFRAEYRELIDLYRNHPSIWMWCAHNEPLPYNFVQDHKMDSIAAEMDPSRPHKRESGFTEHFYPGWYDPPYGRQYTDIDRWKPRLASEYGAQGIPNSMKEVIPEPEQWPISKHEDTWKFHDFQKWTNYKYIGHPKAFGSLDEYIDTSQKYQYDYNKYVTEYFRRLKYEPTGGIYSFQFNDPWPSVSWGVVDHKRQEKMAFKALRDAMSPTLASIEWKKTAFTPGDVVEAPLWLINDRHEELQGTRLQWKLYAADDKEKKPVIKGETAVDAPADSSRSIETVKFAIPKDARPGQKWILDVAWTGAGGKKLSDNVYMFGVAQKKSGNYRYEPVYPEYPPAG